MIEYEKQDPIWCKKIRIELGIGENDPYLDNDDKESIIRYLAGKRIDFYFLVNDKLKNKKLNICQR